MDSPKVDKTNLSRRDFLRASAISASAIAGGGILAGCAQKPAEFVVEEAAAPVEAAVVEAGDMGLPKVRPDQGYGLFTDYGKACLVGLVPQCP